MPDKPAPLYEAGKSAALRGHPPATCRHQGADRRDWLRGYSDGKQLARRGRQNPQMVG